jgi:uncharacterized membrane protein
MAMQAAERTRSDEDRTLKDLTPNVAALLCYVAGWISGIVFLVLEQKNRFVRFHALQSIIVFGTLTVAGVILGSLPVVGAGFHWVIWVLWFVLWIILMVKAVTGEAYKIPWSGNLADRLANESMGPPAPTDARKEEPAVHTARAEPIAPVQRQISRVTKADEFKAKYYSLSARAGRIASSGFAIAWSIALLIFFNFYYQYIAYYEPIHSGGATHWQIHTLVTSGFVAWLPILTATLVLAVVGHALLIAFDKYILRQTVRIILDVFGIATVLTLLSLFPFDFSAIPSAEAIDGVTLGITIGLIVMAVGFGIGALARFIQAFVHAAQGEY